MIEAIPSTISQVKTLTKSIRLTVDTQENLSPETFAKIFELKDKLGWFFFADAPEKLPDTIDTLTLPKIQVEEGQKTPSQRLRAAYFVWWDQQGKPTGDFESYYRREVEKIINQIKERLT